MTAVLEQGFGCLSLGLAFMHVRNIRHKDIKPQNILVHHERLIFTDFGASLDFSNGRATSEGRPSIWTRRYAPPGVLEYESRDPNADVFSLGCVFIEMFCALALIESFDQELTHDYAQNIDSVHDGLLFVTPAPKLLVLPELIIAMTDRISARRPTSDIVAQNLCRRPDFVCLDCVSRPKNHPFEMLWPLAAQAISRGELGGSIVGTYTTWNPQHYEMLDPCKLSREDERLCR